MPTEYDLIEVPYYRDTAVSYADYWAYRRNPNYYSFDSIGGDCTNFVSQALYAANGVMNFLSFGYSFVLLILCLLSLSSGTYNPFIYFRF